MPARGFRRFFTDGFLSEHVASNKNSSMLNRIVLARLRSTKINRPSPPVAKPGWEHNESRPSLGCLCAVRLPRPKGLSA
jgi:hypothetical protein